MTHVDVFYTEISMKYSIKKIEVHVTQFIRSINQTHTLPTEF